MDFIREKIFPIKRKYLPFGRLSKFIGWKVFNKIFYKFFSIDLTRKVFVSSLKGYSQDELALFAKQFIAEYLCSRKIEITQQMLKASLSKGERVILISASLDFIVKEVATELGVEEYIATTLDYDSMNRICKGVIANDLLGRKTNVVTSHNLDISNALVVTDNLSDAALVKGSAAAFIVSKSKHRNFWKKFTNVKEIYVFN